MDPRSLAVAAARTRAFSTLVDLLERLDRGRPDVLPILTYHRVAEPDDDHYPGLTSATPTTLAVQVRELGRRFGFIDLGRLVARAAGGPAIAPRSLLVTFDDADAAFAEQAWPILRAAGVPVVLFVPTAYPGQPEASFWWDRLYAALMGTARREPLVTALGPLPMTTRPDRVRAFRSLRDHLKALPHGSAMGEVDGLVTELGGGPPIGSTLDWSRLRRLAAEGVTLAPHSRVHPLLGRIDPATLDLEIGGSREDLAREIGAGPSPAFAYPSGDHPPAAVDSVRRLGFSVAFTTVRGVNDLRRADWLRLRRINVGGRASAAALRAQALTVLAR